MVCSNKVGREKRKLPRNIFAPGSLHVNTSPAKPCVCRSISQAEFPPFFAMGAGTRVLEPPKDGSTRASAAQTHTHVLPGGHMALCCLSVPPIPAPACSTASCTPLMLFLSLICRHFSYGITLRTAFKFSTTSPGMKRGEKIFLLL